MSVGWVISVCSAYVCSSDLCQPAVVGGNGQEGDVALALVRRGWDNPDGASRASLQKVEYRLVEDRLERTAYRYLDGAEAMATATVLGGIETLSLRYRDEEGAWRERWDPTGTTDLPDWESTRLNFHP